MLSILAVAVMSACKNEAESYQKAMASNSVETLQVYLEEFPDAPTEHADSVALRIEELVADNTDYEAFTSAMDIVQKYDAAEYYSLMHTEGLHIEEINQFIEKNTEEYEKVKEQRLQARLQAEYEEKYGDLRDRLQNFKYCYPQDRRFYFVFSAPDLNGEGYGIMRAYDLFSGTKWNFTYTVKKNDELYFKFHDDKGKAGNIGTANIYSDAAYIDPTTKKSGSIESWWKKLSINKN
ncbi:MAG: hypothetical protein IJ417_03950 [Bacteroidaceae bacterium]|nr:hypothetical protein [Bacteroidaceae bacterium]